MCYRKLGRSGKCLAAIKCNRSDGRDDSKLTTYSIHAYLDGIFSQTEGQSACHTVEESHDGNPMAKGNQSNQSKDGRLEGSIEGYTDITGTIAGRKVEVVT